MPASQLDTLCRSYHNVQAYDQARDAGAIAAAHVAAQRIVTRRSLHNGMVKFEIVVSSDEAAIVWAALNTANAGAAQTPAEPTTVEPTPAEPTDPNCARPFTTDQTPAEPSLDKRPVAKAASPADRGRQRADAFMGISRAACAAPDLSAHRSKSSSRRHTPA